MSFYAFHASLFIECKVMPSMRTWTSWLI